MPRQHQIHFINFSRRLTVNTLLFLIPLYFLKIGFNGWQIGVVISLFAFAPLVFSFPTGWINDRVSIRKIIQASLFGLSLLLFLLGQTENFLLIAVLFLLLGIVNNSLDVSTNSLYFKEESSSDLNKRYSRLAFWLALGMACGTLIGGLVIFFADFKTMFYVYAGFTLAVLVSVRDFNQEKFEAVSIREYRLNLLNKKTLLFVVMIFILSLHWGVEGTVYSLFLKKYLMLNNLQLSLYISLPLFFLALSSFSVGFIRYDPQLNKRLFILSLFLSGLGHILMVNRNLYFSFAFRVIHEIGDGLLGALIVLYISRLFEKKSIGGSSGILLAVMTIGHMVGALFFSPLGHRAGLHYPFIISGILLVANSGYSYLVFRRQQY